MKTSQTNQSPKAIFFMILAIALLAISACSGGNKQQADDAAPSPFQLVDGKLTSSDSTIQAQLNTIYDVDGGVQFVSDLYKYTMNKQVPTEFKADKAAVAQGRYEFLEQMIKNTADGNAELPTFTKGSYAEYLSIEFLKNKLYETFKNIANLIDPFAGGYVDNTGISDSLRNIENALTEEEQKQQEKKQTIKNKLKTGQQLDAEKQKAEAGIRQFWAAKGYPNITITYTETDVIITDAKTGKVLK